MDPTTKLFGESEPMTVSRKGLMVIPLAGCDIFLGQGIPTLWKNLFGGQTLGQSVFAACATVSDDFPIHSVHSYFVLTGNSNQSILFQVERTRDGGSFKTRSCKALQANKEICISQMSFQRNEKGLMHDMKLRSLIPSKYWSKLDPSTFDSLEPLQASSWKGLERKNVLQVKGLELVAFKSYAGIEKSNWKENCSMLAFMSDLGMITVLRNVFPGTNWAMTAATLDHTIHFHRPLDVFVGDWMYFCFLPVAIRGNRGLSTMYVFNQQEELLASVSQEALLRVFDPEVAKRKKEKLAAKM